MARVSAHGTEIGTLDYGRKQLRYMSDGTLLVNKGFGWKLAKVKDGVVINQATFVAAKERQAALYAKRPALGHYVKLLIDAAGMSSRWKLISAIGMMPDDPDGVWSTVTDTYHPKVSIDIDEVVTLCNAYKAAMLEQAAFLKAQESLSGEVD